MFQRSAADVRQRDGAAMSSPERDATGPMAAAHETAITQRPTQGEWPRRYRPQRYRQVLDPVPIFEAGRSSCI